MIDDEELREIQNVIEKTLLKKLRIQEKMGWSDWMTLQRTNGGLGLNSIRDLYQAQQTNGLLLTLNGPDCAAKRALQAQTVEGLDHSREISPDNPLYTVIQALKSQNASLHSRYHQVDTTYLHELIKGNAKFKKAKRAFLQDKKNDVGFWMNTLFTKTLKHTKNIMQERTGAPEKAQE